MTEHNHIRRFTGPQGRRINSRTMVSVTLCGAPVTACDMTWKDAKQDADAGFKFLRCPACRKAVLNAR